MDETKGPTPIGRDARFWLSPEDRGGGPSRYVIIDQFVESVADWHASRQMRMVEYLSAYGVSYDNYGQTSVIPSDDELKFNICEPIVDTAVNKVCKSRVVPMALTVGGSFEERRRARNFNRFISGLFMETGVFEKDYQWITDAFVGDVGIAKVMEKDERVVVERCDPSHVYWDPEEAMLTQDVSVIVEDHFVDRYRLVEMLRDWEEQGKLVCSLEEAIDAVMSAQYDHTDARYFRRPNRHDVVMLREAWHTKSSRKSKDGRHVIVLKGRIDLVSEDYGYTDVPHIFVSRKLPLYGITSPGLMSVLLPGQKEHDRVTERIRQGQDCSPPRLIIRRGGSVAKGQLDDVPGTIIEAEDPASDVVQFNAQPVHPDVYGYRKDLVGDMQLTASVPEMSMNGRPPEGVTAAKALATLDDIVAEKLSQPLRCREQMFVRICERALQRVADISKRHRGKYVVRSEDGKTLEELNYRDVAVPFGSYRLKCFPTNFLSQTPSVRYERLSEMHAAGEISEGEFRSLSEVPDLESNSDMETATQDIVDMCIDAILTKGKRFLAESFDDHKLIVQRGMKTYNLARVQAPDANEDPDGYAKHQARLKALGNYIDSAVNWLQPPPAPPNTAGPGQPPSGAPPMGAPPGAAPDTGPMGMMPPPGAPMQGPGMPPGTNAFGPPPGELISNGQ